MTKREDEREEERDEALVRVQDVPDEATATLLCDFLGEQGIRATAISAQMPAFGMIERARTGFWGHVEVLESDAERARQVIEDFFKARPEPRGTGRARAGENGEETEE
jgi:hypothetical protein